MGAQLASVGTPGRSSRAAPSSRSSRPSAPSTGGCSTRSAASAPPTARSSTSTSSARTSSARWRSPGPPAAPPCPACPRRLRCTPSPWSRRWSPRRRPRLRLPSGCSAGHRHRRLGGGGAGGARRLPGQEHRPAGAYPGAAGGAGHPGSARAGGRAGRVHRERGRPAEVRGFRPLLDPAVPGHRRSAGDARPALHPGRSVHAGDGPGAGRTAHAHAPAAAGVAAGDGWPRWVVRWPGRLPGADRGAAGGARGGPCTAPRAHRQGDGGPGGARGAGLGNRLPDALGVHPGQRLARGLPAHPLGPGPPPDPHSAEVSRAGPPPRPVRRPRRPGPPRRRPPRARLTLAADAAVEHPPSPMPRASPSRPTPAAEHPPSPMPRGSPSRPVPVQPPAAAARLAVSAHAGGRASAPGAGAGGG